MAHKPEDKLVAAWVPGPFKDAVQATAKAAGTSESEVLRRGLTRELIDVSESPEEDEEGSA